MDPLQIIAIIDWINAAAHAGVGEAELLGGFCRRLQEAGVPVWRGMMGADTLHPTVTGRVVTWSDGGGEQLVEYDTTGDPDADDRWRSSPFFSMYERHDTCLRLRLSDPAAGAEFPKVRELREAGSTDYVCIAYRLAATARIGELDFVFSSWSTRAPEGFSESQIESLQTLVGVLATAFRAQMIFTIAETLAGTYLGRDAGARVLAGRIRRGVTDKISAVLWFSDLRGFTRISDTAAPELVIPLLNDYADAVVNAVHGAGGQVLKFIGDGILAIFPMEGTADACLAALSAAATARERVDAVNARRAADGLPVTRFSLALHQGTVFYGNVGSADRLDFTVIGPAVNEASRIAAMCRSLDQEVLLSSAFAAASPECRQRLVSVGRYLLRGVARPQELFTLDPEAAD
ncbi:adenylate/guanylate cyclase domain-containing protein [Azospirillum halopraeferens]|uniref:adenylate/guanylate cyclase domain-containing protein n=1 Tax=Azospirillum halopraeferens TaxID=34010 RepID=UPI0004156E40|nr:adenylate/guanylate cyclase domain-containing protein [Azospirillum halopraeferens]